MAPATVSDNAVRLLTIHGAKGLEAQVVVLLDTDTATRAADTMAVLVDWPAEAAQPDKFFFVSSEARPPVCAQATLDAERLQRGREELNALYVALTRSRNTLVISSIEPHRDAPGSWWRRLVDHTQAEVPPVSGNVPAVNLAGAAPLQVELRGLPALSLAGPIAAPDAATSTPDTAPDDPPAARIGNAMHRLLEWGGADDHHTQAARREFALDADQGGRAADMARRILAGPGAWSWDPDQLSWHSSEVELLSHGLVLRLDRLVLRRDNGEWWVLDHKSAAAPQRDALLVAQLRSYRDAVQGIYPEQPVRAAFLSGQGDWIELPPTGG